MPTGIYPRRKRGPYKVPRHEVTQPLDPSYRLIPLTQGKNAIVDASDFEWLSQWNWCAHWFKSSRNFYAQKRGGIFIHQVILGCKWVDHKNHNTLDNRRQNLRKCTRCQNARNARIRADNTSGFKGVNWHKQVKKWTAQIAVNGEIKHLGVFASKEDAARAYDRAAELYHGEFALKNSPS